MNVDFKDKEVPWNNLRCTAMQKNQLTSFN
jgi:hypothetical protein